MRDKISFATASLHISTFLYLLVGLSTFAFFAFWLPYEQAASEAPRRQSLATGGQFDYVTLGIGVFMLLFCLALIVGIEAVAWGLQRRKFWAWIAGLCIFAMYVPSLFLPLGAFGLWGLLDEGSRAEFGIGRQSRS
ncbi:MAG: hypothetical protein JNM56_00100 [Planctomycetia bacterium]|nr:hypothetical protein [Planctomycetia bacterium]